MARLLRRAQVPGAALTLAVTVVLVIAAPAAAASNHSQNGPPAGVAPPGNSGVSQYVEDLPTLSGGKPTHSVAAAPVTSGGSGGPTSPSASSTPSVPKSVSRALTKQGTTGKAAAALAASTAAASAIKAHDNAITVTSASPTSQVLNTLGGTSAGGGLGAVLPVILIISLLVISAIGIARRRGAN